MILHCKYRFVACYPEGWLHWQVTSESQTPSEAAMYTTRWAKDRDLIVIYDRIFNVYFYYEKLGLYKYIRTARRLPAGEMWRVRRYAERVLRARSLFDRPALVASDRSRQLLPYR